MIKKISAIVCCLAICLSLTACTAGFDSLEYVEVLESDKPSDTLIANNSKYTLEIVKSDMSLVLTDKVSGEKWSTTPIDDGGEQLDEFGMPIKKHPRVQSVLAVECKNFEKDEVNTYYSYIDAVQSGYVTHTATDNGVVINYHFAEAKVMIPLECTLTEYGLRLSVDPTKIQESENKVLAVSIAPFFCGVKNDTENSYLFVPSGSGALIDVSAKSEQGVTYSADIYGSDPAIDEITEISKKEPIRLGVFGTKMNGKAVCAIVDSSAASASVNAISGSSTFGYSTCYARFQVRGYTNHTAQLFYDTVENVVYSKKMINKPLSVTFCPLTGNDANYSGMAKVYRDYLINNFDMQKTSDDLPLSVRVIGGAAMKQSFLGIPYDTVYPTTTLSDAKAIIEELKKELGDDFSVQLKGYGESGVDVGKIAGNYSVHKKLGKWSEIKSLFDYAKDNNIGLYFDFDIERFNKNSGGITKFYDSAANAGELKVLQYNYDLAVKDKKQDTAYNLLSPAKFSTVFEKLAKKTAKFGLSGISLDSLSSVAYSDYSDKENSEYYSKNGFSAAAGKVIDSVKGADKSFMASAANLYSAVRADIITEVPVGSEKSAVFLCDIPFYQMVFKGSVPMTAQSINLSADPEIQLLKAVESGIGLGYTVINNWESSLINADAPLFYNSVFGDIKDSIIKNTKELSDYYNKISGMCIISHTVLENQVRETVFENGVAVYVNYTDQALSTPAGEIGPRDYLITEK
ncbi:MAG: hypothetical protein J6B93_04865 [Clostridia bacterium]|nr:hypothetical protein [Clostridia bacterium]